MNKEMEEFRKIVQEMIDLKEKKAGDYGQTWKIFGLPGIYPLIAKKFARLWINKDKPAVNLNYESLRDTFIDMAVYSIMAVQLMDSGETEDKMSKLING